MTKVAFGGQIHDFHFHFWTLDDLDWNDGGMRNWDLLTN